MNIQGTDIFSFTSELEGGILSVWLGSRHTILLWFILILWPLASVQDSKVGCSENTPREWSIDMGDSPTADAHVFISYVCNNKRLVQRLCDDLTKYGVKVWLDRKDIDPGVYWKQAIRRAIQDGAFFIACFSKQYNQRPKTYMNEELALAVEELRQRLGNEQAWFIPVMLSKCKIPDIDIGASKTLRDLQYVELYKDRDASIRRILDVVQPIPPEMQTFAGLLHSDDPGLRIAGARKLAEAARIGAVGASSVQALGDELIEALGDENCQVRIYVVQVLGHIGDSRAVPKLIEKLGDESDRVRGASIVALRMIGKPAIPKLMEALSDEDAGVRANAAIALRQIGDSGAVPALVEALGDRSDQVRVHAASAMQWIGNAYAVQALIRALGDSNQRVCENASRALTAIGGPAVNALAKIMNSGDHRIFLYAAEALKNVRDPSAKPALKETLDNENELVGAYAAEALRMIGTPEALIAVEEYKKRMKGKEL